MNIGLVLSGGGIKGVAHIGAIKALEEHGIFPTHISGSSAGAVVGAFYAAGYTTKEMTSFFKSMPLFSINKYAFKKPGFIDTDKFYSDFLNYFPDDNFSFLKKKLFITTVNMLNGEIKVFDHGQLIKPLLASAAFPGVFSPIKIGSNVFADGGILDNFPIAPIKPICQQLIGIYASPISKIEPNQLKRSFNVLNRAIRINFSNSSFSKFSECDILIFPESLNMFGLFNKNNIDEIIEIGYQTALKRVEEYKKRKVLNKEYFY